MDEAGALAYGVIKRARLVVLRITEEVVPGRGYPKEAWWNAVLPAYQHCLDTLERILRCLDE
jgi:hypothetical protein